MSCCSADLPSSSATVMWALNWSPLTTILTLFHGVMCYGTPQFHPLGWFPSLVLKFTRGYIRKSERYSKYSQLEITEKGVLLTLLSEPLCSYRGRADVTEKELAKMSRYPLSNLDQNLLVSEQLIFFFLKSTFSNNYQDVDSARG